jgi:hypothetical protein
MDKQNEPKQRKPIQVLRERCGGMSERLKAYYKEQNSLRKQLREQLQGGARTIPELVAATGLDTTRLTWHVMAMKKYGELCDAGLDGDYYRYRLKEAEHGS